MAFTFPVFFGFMLGDIGYGLALLLLFAYLRYAMPKAKRMCDIVILSAISSIIFGYIYGEVFGLEHIFGIELHPIIHRAHEIPTMFLIALGLGAFHLNMGLILGIINESHHYGWFMAFVKKGSWIVFQAGALLVAAAKGLLVDVPVLSAIHTTPMIAWSVLGLGIAGILYGEKMQGLFELPSIFGNLLSYLRLVAIGLSSVYIALVVNDLGGAMFTKGGTWMVLAIIIIIFGHTLNLALGLLGPFMHSLRLHYAEFFMKFYAGGGKKYQPFGAVRT
jgi:V/A-type H+-transporting ATPase subunit I